MKTKEKVKNQKTKLNKVKSPAELRSKFLKGAEPLIDEYIKVSLGKGNLSSKDGTARAEVWSLLKDILLKADDVQKIKATNTSDVLKLLAAGKITLQQSKELMQIMQTEFEIKELPKLLAQFEGLQK